MNIVFFGASVTQQTKNFPLGQSLLTEDTNSFCCYNFENRDIPKLMKNNLDLVKFVNITFNHLGLCYVMKYKEGGGLPGDSKYIDLFTLRQLKNKSSLFIATVNGISFAIPIDTAALIIKQLIQNRKVIRPFVGLKMANTVSVPKEYDHLTRRGGRNGGIPSEILSTAEQKVVVLDVVKDSPAQKAGLQR